MSRSLSSRSAVAPFQVMELVRAAIGRQASHGDAILLCVGQPSTPAPRAVLDAVHLAIDTELLGYTQSDGIPALRAAIAGHYATSYGLAVDPGEVLVSNGSSGGFSTLLLAAFEPGARIAMTRPGYPAYRNILTALGCEVVELGCGPAQDYRLSVAAVAEAHRHRPLAGLVVASPANPTGTMIDGPQLAALTGWCAEHGVRLVSDEIYHGITDGDPGSCAWSFDRSAVVVSSFSKYWGMTGWRLGWSLVPDDLRGVVDALAGNFALCAPVPAQHAAVAAFSEQSYAEAETAVRGFADARELLLAAVDDLGWTGVAPADGAFYVYAEIGDVLGPYPDSPAWCAALLADQGVALTPGSDFDPVHGGTAVRVSLAAGPDAVAAAIVRILRFQASLEEAGTPKQ